MLLLFFFSYLLFLIPRHAVLDLGRLLCKVFQAVLSAKFSQQLEEELWRREGRELLQCPPSPFPRSSLCSPSI